MSYKCDCRLNCRCSQVKQIYLKRGETCIDNFRIPEKHLEGLYIWNVTHPEPIRVARAPGPGLPHTDYVLYVQSRMLGQCLSSVSNHDNGNARISFSKFDVLGNLVNLKSHEWIVWVILYQVFQNKCFGSKQMLRFKTRNCISEKLMCTGAIYRTRCPWRNVKCPSCRRTLLAPVLNVDYILMSTSSWRITHVFVPVVVQSWRYLGTFWHYANWLSKSV
jgi:hypothetical protein